MFDLINNLMNNINLNPYIIICFIWFIIWFIWHYNKYKYIRKRYNCKNIYNIAFLQLKDIKILYNYKKMKYQVKRLINDNLNIYVKDLYKYDKMLLIKELKNMNVNLKHKKYLYTTHLI
jgi:hypothetical protein